MLVRCFLVAAACVSCAHAFNPSVMIGLLGAKMNLKEPEVSRKQLLQGAAGLAIGFLANEQAADAASSILDRQKSVLAGKVTVGANKLSILDAEIASMQVVKKKKAPVLDVGYVLRYSALYLTPLVDDMEALAARDAEGVKIAGGRGIPKIGSDDKSAAQKSPLYKYVEEVRVSIADLSKAAKASDFAGVTAASAAIKISASNFLSAANTPAIFN